MTMGVYENYDKNGTGQRTPSHRVTVNAVPDDTAFFRLLVYQISKTPVSSHSHSAGR